MSKKKFNAVGVHIYAGGFTLGVEKHFNVLAHLEEWPFGVDVMKVNRPKLPVHQLGAPGGWPGFKGISLIYANPPCAPWSAASSGRSTSWHNDGRLDCARRCYNLVAENAPTIYIHESVRGMYTKGRAMVSAMALEAAQAGYAPYYVLTNAQNHGVAQNRPRFFLILSKVELDFKPTGVEPVTSGQVLARGPFSDTTVKNMAPKALWPSILNKVQQGERVVKAFAREFPDTIGKPRVGRGNFLHMRLDPDAPAPVFGHETIHPTLNRFLTVGECAALAGFPDDYKFVGGSMNRYHCISKGVLPPVAEYVARVAAAGLRRGARPATRDPRQVIVGRDEVEVTVV